MGQKEEKENVYPRNCSTSPVTSITLSQNHLENLYIYTQVLNKMRLFNKTLHDDRTVPVLYIILKQ